MTITLKEQIFRCLKSAERPLMAQEIAHRLQKPLTSLSSGLHGLFHHEGFILRERKEGYNRKAYVFSVNPDVLPVFKEHNKQISRLTCWIDIRIYERIRIRAGKEKRSIQNFVDQALTEWIDQNP